MRSTWTLAVAAACVVAACSSPETTSEDETASAPTPTAAPTTASTISATPAPTTSAPITTASSDRSAEPRVLLVGDSTLLAVEAYSAQDSLQGFVGDLEVASCRTVGVPSCGVPPRPSNVVEVIRSSEGPYDIVVVMAGYDEWWASFPASLEQVGMAIREVGAQTLLFLNFREGQGYVAPDGRLATEAFELNNETLEFVDTVGAIPELVVADWLGYTAGPIGDEWLEGDGIHLTRLGAWGVGDYISRWVAHLTQRPCPTAPSGPPCQSPDASPERPTREALLPDG